MAEDRTAARSRDDSFRGETTHRDKAADLQVSFEDVVDAAERGRQADREEAVFVARRLARRAGSNGVSSDALVAAAATGSTIPEEVRPWDLGDYGRCCEAFALAPYSLRRKMLPKLVEWGELLGKELVERGR